MAEQPHERVGFGRRQVGEDSSEPLAKQCAGGTECLLTRLRGGQCLPAAVPCHRKTLQQAGLAKTREKLRDSWSGHPGSTSELGSRDVLVRDRPQREVLRHGEWLIMGCQETLHPASGERGDEREGIDGGVVESAGARQR